MSLIRIKFVHTIFNTLESLKLRCETSAKGGIMIHNSNEVHGPINESSGLWNHVYGAFFDRTRQLTNGPVAIF